MRAWFEMNIAKALFDPEDWDEREVREVVESDWVRENGMGDSMNHEKFQKVRVRHASVTPPSLDSPACRCFRCVDASAV